MIFAAFRCRICKYIYFVGIYMFSLPKNTEMVTEITFKLYLYQQNHSKKLNYHYPNTKNTEIWSNIVGQPIVAR